MTTPRGIFEGALKERVQSNCAEQNGDHFSDFKRRRCKTSMTSILWIARSLVPVISEPAHVIYK